eukprot:12339962-Ditylum_brightwellii.AAC.1
MPHKTEYIGPCNKQFHGTHQKTPKQYSILPFLLASISEAAKIKLLAKESNFHVNGVQIAAAFFKLLMEKTVIDTVVTTNTYWTNLQELDSYMAQ